MRVMAISAFRYYTGTEGRTRLCAGTAVARFVAWSSQIQSACVSCSCCYFMLYVLALTDCRNKVFQVVVSSKARTNIVSNSLQTSFFRVPLVFVNKY
jgi:hypothetical protein